MSVDEVDETFVVNLSAATNATIADTQGLGTIVERRHGTVHLHQRRLPDGGELGDREPHVHGDALRSERQDRHGRLCLRGRHRHRPGRLLRGHRDADVQPRGAHQDVQRVRSSATRATSSTRRSWSNLSTPVNVTIADGQGVGTILDNDPIPTLSINNVTVTEGDTGTVTATFTATLSAASGKTVTVDYATSAVTANAPADYTAATGTLTFTPGTTTRAVAIDVQGDVSDEPDETYRVTLSNPGNATIAAAIGTGTITDDDPVPSIAIDDVTVAEGSAGTTKAHLTVSLSAAERLHRHRELRRPRTVRRPSPPTTRHRRAPSRSRPGRPRSRSRSRSSAMGWTRSTRRSW